MISSFEDLRVWQKAHELTIEIYRITKQYPDEERYGLISQMRRGAVSIEANIAEGAARRTTKDFIHFLYQSIASCQELRCLLRISKDLGYIDEGQFKLLNGYCLDVIRMTKKLITSLSCKIPIL